ncbi:Phospho-N-acetylmuramoyl-pentapeptide-transferase [uncultured Ruminococcus sp.]|uniref:phospho-N-acetylmuramoyl-pentapeptide- transferase n=1 Tax=Massiliimalia timonensis TaxID=1987501 RepID=UPI000823334D|nr:phospho-N-acetylmuramoyl-pentapeptide-transferase [Massiliimalia timonensis]SCH28859.1 Phospho-N-acetylmuramoyl-pentapeptide-transferase [uncultured Ruminococcus sp.]SCH32896.1 Phospho-N-acetylmuramoyl-pentapeptide-transferase [uncultured Clostridium sp.]
MGITLGSSGVATILTAVIAFGLTASLGIFLVPYLKKLKYGQTIKEIGPTWHQAKNGTPTMGGIMFIIGIIVAVIAGYITALIAFDFQIDQIQSIKLVAGVVMALGFGLMGYVDDYIKVVKKRNLGLRAREKLLVQFVLSVGYLFILKMAGALSTIVEIPFFGQVDFGWFYYPFMVVLIVGFVNAVNLTDGVDGLASSVTFVFALAFMVYTMKLTLPYLGLFAVAVAAGCLGFLVWNFHPAKVFMGDTGSMFLGGCVVALAFGLDMPLLLFIVGFIYWGEAASVILQVISFKLTGKRIFKMSPIHHHFEMSGWSEVKIVGVFSLVTLIVCVIGYFALPI